MNKLIPLDDAVAGMVLSTNLMGSHNEKLLPGGTVLTDSMISSLRRHQVEEVEVEIEEEFDAEAEAENAQNEKLKLEKKLARLDKLFKLTEHEKLNQQLKNYIIQFLTVGEI
ncbi:hypothetical protein [Solimicrobium silvestre]|uniref:Uncharacterized protein n=1 Tax=Solimicrobium silvestre TaxID=2099400 RepID=A0A2S9H082_9BURK|nr:hypothetical protein [Solimicrobium silvestre]PRC93363.1 hypothetical protein S2091_2101 [Solimicrobium silvestre]